MYNRIDSPETCSQSSQSVPLIGSMYSTQTWFFVDQIDYQIDNN